MITTDGVALHEEITGQGRPVVFVHGWTMSCRFFEKQRDALSRHLKIVTYDLRGHGRSGKSRRNGNLQRHAADLHEFLVTHDLQNAILCGWSLGCSITLEYWQKFSGDRIAALCLIEGAPSPMSPEEWNAHQLRGKNSTAIDMYLNACMADRVGFGRLLIKGFFANLPETAILQWMLQEHLLADTSSAIKLYRDYVQHDFSAILQQIDIPVWAVYGSGGRTHNGMVTGQHMESIVPNCQLHEFKKSGHMPFFEESDKFNLMLESLIRQIT